MAWEGTRPEDCYPRIVIIASSLGLDTGYSLIQSGFEPFRLLTGHLLSSLRGFGYRPYGEADDTPK